MDFDLPNWKKLGDVQWGSHPLLIFEKDNFLLLLLAEKRGDRTIGFACSACKTYKIQGDSSNLDLVHFPTELTVIKKLNASYPSSYLLAYTRPSYASFSESAVLTCAESHFKQLQELHCDVKSACKVNLIEPSKEENELLTSPDLLFSLLSSLRSAAKPQSARSAVGIDLKGDEVMCSVPSLSLGLVAGGSKEQRLHVLHLLSEEVLQQNAVVIIFDTCNKFAGLAHPNALDLKKFTAFSLPGLPAGFPTREITPGKNAFVSLSSFSPSSILAPFGLQENELTKHLSKSLENSMEEIQDSELKQFTQLKLNRIMRLISFSLQGIFALGKPVLDVSYSLGKVLHVNLTNCSPEARAFFCMGLLKELEKVNNPVFLLFEQDASEITSLLKLSIDKFLGSNVSILCHCEDENDVPFVKSADFFVEIIDQDVAITREGKPPVRVKLRPTYSACTEL